jgi:large subunit ribosomal protein L13
MAVLISKFIRGTHKPGYLPNRHDHGDVCVVVNASQTRVTGRKKYQKVYRYHTGYPGALHETDYLMQLEKNPEKVIHHAVSKMLPKNRNRPFLFKKYLIVHGGPVHNQHNFKLPQFTVPQPFDINETFKIDELMDKDQAQIEYMNTDKIPEELQAFDKNLQEQYSINPQLAYKKEFTVPKENLFMNKYLRRSFRKEARFRMNKRI